jgi:protein-tyrosine-phosphatase
MVEFRVDEATGRHWFLEINGRFWGSLPLALFAGADFPAALVDLHLADGDPPPARVRTGVYARNVAKDIQWTKEAIRARRRSAEGLTISLPRALLEWSRVFGGREVWDGASLRDPAPIVAELRECLQREISGVASVAARAWRRWRARTASRARLRKAAYCSRILVLCEGNICRSAFVQARLRAAEGFTSAVRSAGFLSAEGRSSPPDFQKLASTRGVDLSAHRSRRVTQEDLDWAELILIMDAANFESLEGMDRRSVAKTIWLGALDTGDAIEIRDPYGLTAEECDRVLDRLDRCVTAFLDLLDRT